VLYPIAPAFGMHVYRNFETSAAYISGTAENTGMIPFAILVAYLSEIQLCRQNFFCNDSCFQFLLRYLFFNGEDNNVFRNECFNFPRFRQLASNIYYFLVSLLLAAVSVVQIVFLNLREKICLYTAAGGGAVYYPVKPT